MTDDEGQRSMSRRDALKAAGLAGAAVLSTNAVSSAQPADGAPTVKNPYGGVPGGGMTLPPYYRPTPYLVSNNIYYPGQEQIGPDEMRISFIGSTPIPVTRAQAGTCIMVELGNGKRFFFDFGSGCMRNIIAMAVPLQTAASRDGHARGLRRGIDPGDHRRDSRPLQRVVPVRCARRRGRQLDQRSCLDAQGFHPRCRQHGSPEPERRHRPVRSELDESGSQIPEYRHTTADMQEPAVRDREIDPKKYYPSDMYRQPQRNFPSGFKIDVSQMVQTKLRATQAKLTGEQEKLQQLINKIEGQ